LASTSCISVSTYPSQHPPAWKTANPKPPPPKKNHRLSTGTYQIHKP
jgi:hypothetical protein